MSALPDYLAAWRVARARGPVPGVPCHDGPPGTSRNGRVAAVVPAVPGVPADGHQQQAQAEVNNRVAFYLASVAKAVEALAEPDPDLDAERAVIAACDAGDS